MEYLYLYLVRTNNHPYRKALTAKNLENSATSFNPPPSAADKYLRSPVPKQVFLRGNTIFQLNITYTQPSCRPCATPWHGAHIVSVRSRLSDADWVCLKSTRFVTR